MEAAQKRQALERLSVKLLKKSRHQTEWASSRFPKGLPQG